MQPPCADHGVSGGSKTKQKLEIISYKPSSEMGNGNSEVVTFQTEGVLGKSLPVFGTLAPSQTSNPTLLKVLEIRRKGW